MTFEYKNHQDYADYLKGVSGRAQRSLVILHHSDMDGAFAGASVFRFAPKIQEALNFPSPKIVAMPVNYNAYKDEEILALVGDDCDVFVVDFCFPMELSRKIAEKAGFFVTLDHHKSSALEMGEEPWAIFDMSASGARMAWEYFMTKNEEVVIPLAITLADNRDLWKKTDGREDAFHEVGMLVRNDIYKREWDKMFRNEMYLKALQPFLDNDKETVRQIHNWGTPVVAKRDSNIAYICNDDSVMETTLAGHPAVLINYGVDQSDALEYLYKQDKYKDKICATFSFKHGHLNFSLRKNAELDIDLSEVAKAYGGGGHAAAAGFVTDIDRGMKIVLNKEKWAMCSLAAHVDHVLETSENQTGIAENLLNLPVTMESRLYCETDESLLQWLPYLILRNEDGDVFVYQRPDQGTEARLHGNLSIGLGGHVDSLPAPGVSLARHLAIEGARELREEVGLVTTGEYDLVNAIETKIIHGDFGTLRLKGANAVSEVHMGLAIILDVKSEWVTNVNVEEVRNARWIPSKHLLNLPTRLGLDYEIWSHVVVTQSDI